MAIKRVELGMKRAGMQKLHDELEEQLALTSDSIEVQIYGDDDEHGAVLTITNDDMERPEVPEHAVYVETSGD